MIDEAEFLTTLTNIFRSELDSDDLTLTLSSSPTTIPQWDSLAQIRIIMGVERAYSVQFEADEIEKIDSVAAFYKIVKHHLQ